MASIDNVFSVTTNDVIKVRESRIKNNKFVNKYPIISKIKAYFSKKDEHSMSIDYLSTQEVNEYWKKAVNNYMQK